MPAILFVCVENSCCSQMAEGFARRLAGPGWTVASAGSHPSGTVHSRAAAFMKERGIDLASHRSKGLDELPPITWDAVVTLGCGDACPHVPARRRIEWDLPDPKDLPGDECRRVRDEIERPAGALLRDLSPSPSPARTPV